MRRILLTSAAVLLMAPAAFAQSMPAQSHSTAAAAPAQMAANTPASGGVFTNVSSQEELSSNLVGLDIYNSANQEVGKIKDVAFDQSGVKAFIVSVGGVMGVGTHYVAVQPSAVNISYDSQAKKWRASMNTSQDQLKAAPEFKDSSNG